MEQNFFSRRKILRRTNTLDLHPEKLLGSEPRDNGCLNLLLPRFKNKLSSKLLQPAWKDKFIRIKLDAFGSAVWNLMDGNANAGDICEKLTERFPEKLTGKDEIEERVGKFLSLLYQQRFITFRELGKEQEEHGKQK
jgi:hypothetical protein